MVSNKLQYRTKSNLRIFFKCFGRIFLLIICVLGLMLAGFYHKHSFYKIYGASMFPSIASEGYSCFINTETSYTYGDIVIAYDPTIHTSPVIKRVIATGGDFVGFVFNNSPSNQNHKMGYYQILLFKQENPTQPVLLEEPYLIQGIADTTHQNQLLVNTHITYQKFLASPKIAQNLSVAFLFGQFIHLYQVAENHVFLLGDNREVSIDSATYGAVPANSIKGKVEYIFQDSVSTFEIALKDILGL